MKVSRVSVLSSLAKVWVVSVWSRPSLLLFTAFHASHYFLVVIVSSVDYTLSFVLAVMFYIYLSCHLDLLFLS